MSNFIKRGTFFKSNLITLSDFFTEKSSGQSNFNDLNAFVASNTT